MSDVLDGKTIKALSTETRQQIMKMLAKRPHTASEIAKLTGKHVTTVTQHLDTLESSDLIRRKDSSNKWKYYTLTEKGEHLFKPKFYSWVVTFAVSSVLVFVGLLRMFSPSQSAVAETAMSTKSFAVTEDFITATPVDYASLLLIVAGIIGISYVLYRKRKSQ